MTESRAKAVFQQHVTTIGILKNCPLCGDKQAEFQTTSMPYARASYECGLELYADEKLGLFCVQPCNSASKLTAAWLNDLGLGRVK